MPLVRVADPFISVIIILITFFISLFILRDFKLISRLLPSMAMGVASFVGYVYLEKLRIEASNLQVMILQQHPWIFISLEIIIIPAALLIGLYLYQKIDTTIYDETTSKNQ
ncbi:MAG: hypothetical protein V1712_01530 [Patescibacteria group bacterium]